MALTKELIRRSKGWTMMTDVREVLHDACGLLENVFQIDAGYFLYYHEETHTRMEYSWGFDIPEKDLNAAVYASDEFLPQLQANQGHWMKVDEAPEVWQKILREERIVRAAGWLISINDDVIGVFVLGHRTVEQDRCSIISLSMAHICLMIEMIIYRRSAEQASLRDPLTGLLNRRGLRLESERLRAAACPHRTLVLIVVDVDDLKGLNDKHGHLAGDALLIQVGHLVQVNLQIYNGICARYGGDEFVVLTQLESADVLEFEHQVSSWFEEHGINVSIGCAVFGRDGDHFEDCFKIADERMYQRKLGVSDYSPAGINRARMSTGVQDNVGYFSWQEKFRTSHEESTIVWCWARSPLPPSYL